MAEAVSCPLCGNLAYEKGPSGQARGFFRYTCSNRWKCGHTFLYNPITKQYK